MAERKTIFVVSSVMPNFRILPTGEFLLGGYEGYPS